MHRIAASEGPAKPPTGRDGQAERAEWRTEVEERGEEGDVHDAHADTCGVAHRGALQCGAMTQSYSHNISSSNAYMCL